MNIIPTQNKVAAPSIQIENPFKQTKSASEIAMDARTAELENLQKKTTAPAMVTPAAFPKTIDDLSFTDRMANASAGYEPYKDLKSYKTPKFETEDEYYERMKSVLTHNIHYVGATASGCPPTYMTGRGATISCRPTIENGTCTAWCTDVSLTKCQNKYTIAPSENTDKTFYGKCTCNHGYVLNGNKCAKPGDQVYPPTTNCSDPTYMDSNCKCTVVPNTHEESGKCVCNNGKNIANNCTDTPPSNNDTYLILQCRVKPDRNRGVGIRNIGDKLSSGFDPHDRKTLDCANAYADQGILNTCFSNCTVGNTKQGKINELLDAIGMPKFCTGHELIPGGTDGTTETYYYFSTRDVTNIVPISYNSTQVAAIKQKLLDNTQIVKAHCQDRKRSWLIYILKKSGSEFIIDDIITLD